MNYKNLQQQQQKAIYHAVAGRVDADHHKIVVSKGISAETVIREAYKELAEQIQKDETIARLTGTGTMREIITPPINRGDVPIIRLSVAKKIMNYLNTHDTSITIDDLAHATNTTYAAVFSALRLAKVSRYVTRTSKRPFKYFLKSRGDPELRAMLPVGTKMTMMK